MALKIKCVICNEVISNPKFGEMTCGKKECLKSLKEYEELSAYLNSPKPVGARVMPSPKK